MNWIVNILAEYVCTEEQLEAARKGGALLNDGSILYWLNGRYIRRVI